MWCVLAKLTPSRIAIIILTLAVAAISTSGNGSLKRDGQLAAFPRLTVWAWENPEDLRKLDPQLYAVAYLDQTIFLSPRVHSRPRFQRLLVSSRTRIIAVVRIEPPRSGDRLDPQIQSAVAHLIQSSALKPRTSMLQIDFDATLSQRDFYAGLIRDVRQGMPAGMPLSITALASWCAGDDWITGLPIDEAVPMFFRMGPDRPTSILPGWTYPLREPLCAASAGVSTDEPWPALGSGRRLYIFHPGSWTSAAMVKMEAMVKP